MKSTQFRSVSLYWSGYDRDDKALRIVTGITEGKPGMPDVEPGICNRVLLVMVKLIVPFNFKLPYEAHEARKSYKTRLYIWFCWQVISPRYTCGSPTFAACQIAFRRWP